MERDPPNDARSLGESDEQFEESGSLEAAFFSILRYKLSYTSSDRVLSEFFPDTLIGKMT
jgi:hypothetical protein